MFESLAAVFRSFFYTMTYSALLFFSVVLDLHLSVRTVKQFRRMTFDCIFATLSRKKVCTVAMKSGVRLLVFSLVQK